MLPLRDLIFQGTLPQNVFEEHLDYFCSIILKSYRDQFNLKTTHYSWLKQLLRVHLHHIFASIEIITCPIPTPAPPAESNSNFSTYTPLLIFPKKSAEFIKMFSTYNRSIQKMNYTQKWATGRLGKLVDYNTLNPEWISTLLLWYSFFLILSWQNISSWIFCNIMINKNNRNGNILI